MPSTRGGSESSPSPKLDSFSTSLRHVVENILKVDEDSATVQAIHDEGITEIDDLLILERDFKDDPLLFTPSPSAPPKPIPAPQRYLITRLQNFCAQYLHDHNDEYPTEGEWLKLTRKDLHSFGTPSVLPPAPGTTASGSKRSSSALTPAQIFKKGIRRDMNDFPELSQQKKFLPWHNAFTATIHAQDLSTIIDPNYTPSTSDERELFSLQQDYVFKVFQKTLHTDTGRALVAKYSSTRSANLLYQELVTHSKTSTEADLAIGHLDDFLKNSRLDRTWRGTTAGYVAHWQTQLRDFEEIADPADRYTDSAKKRMLQRAVAGIPELDQIKDTDEVVVAMAVNLQLSSPSNSGPRTTRMTYEQYASALTSACTRYDAKQAAVRSRHRTRASNIHDMAYNPLQLHTNAHNGNYVDDGDSFITTDLTIDDTLSMISYEVFAANQAARHPNRPWIPREIFELMKIHPELLQAWNSYDWNKAPGNRDLESRRSATRRAHLHDTAPDPYAPFYDLAIPPDNRMVHQAITGPPVVPASALRGDIPSDQDTPPLRDDATSQGQQQQRVRWEDSKPPVQAGNVRQLIQQAHQRASNLQQQAHQHSSSVSEPKKSVTINGVTYYANMHTVRFRAMLGSLREVFASLLDWGCNGGNAGEDCRLLFYTTPARYADVTGIADHTISNLRIGTFAAVVKTQYGLIVIIMHQYAHYGKGKTIHSVAQWEYRGHKGDVRSKVCGGTQRVITADGYAIPLQIRNGLPYLEMRPPTDHELEHLPQVHITSDVPWDPTVLDCEQTVDQMTDLPPENLYGVDHPFDREGNFRPTEIYSLDIGDGMYCEMCFDDYVEECVSHTSDWEWYSTTRSQRDPKKLPDDDPTVVTYLSEDLEEEHDDTHLPTQVQRELKSDPLARVRATDIVVRGKAMELNSLRPFFLWQPNDIIRKTIENTTQFGRISPDPLPYKVKFKTTDPAANIARRNEAVSGDIIYSDTPAVDGGETAATVFFGLESHVTTGHGIKSDSQFVDTLQDEVRRLGAMDKLITDRGSVCICDKTVSFLRAICTDSWQSKPYHEHQNPVERRYQDVKRFVNKVLNMTGAPAFLWLCALLWVLYILNHSYCEAIGGIPLTKLTGQTVDISNLFQFQFYEKVYYTTSDKLSYASKPGFPSDSDELPGYFVGFSESVGDVMTFKILTAHTNKIIYRSNVRSAVNTDQKNLRHPHPHGDGEMSDTTTKTVFDLDSPLGDDDIEFVKSPPRIPFGDNGEYVSHDGEITGSHFKTFQPDELMHRTYLTPVDKKGQRFCARIIEKIFDPSAPGLDVEETPENVKFMVTYDHEGRDDEILSYNKILDHVEREIEATSDPDHVVWRFQEIIAHEGPLRPDDPSYMGSTYNVKVLWSDGTTTYEPLSVIGADDPVTCAVYARKNGLLDKPGWKRFKRIAKNEKKLKRFLNQAKMQSQRSAKRYQYGYEVPNSPAHALELDKAAGNTKWQDSMALELHQIMEYKTFQDMGKGDRRPRGYKKIKAHWVFAIKHDGRHKSRLVAGGHMTDTPIESVYSGVVSIRSL